MNPGHHIQFNLFPGGRDRCLALTYDDAPQEDYRFVEILNRHGLRGTFHVNSGGMGRPDRVKREDMRSLYANHEVSVHGVGHMHLDDLPPEELVHEILEDRKRLEEVMEYAIVGMAHAFGSYNAKAVAMLSALGFRYARPVAFTRKYVLPEDYMHWNPTCHHNDDILARWEQFMTLRNWGKPRLFYLFGHSYEFERGNNWHIIEDFAKTAGGHPEVWYATSIEVAEYVASFRNVRLTADRSRITNRNADPVWVTADGMPLEVPGGATVVLPALVETAGA
ncbi:polysaccharide deacetylase [Verrucomicrobia bacterium LW23]|nr:polysaccharide deacetylase [Verrucomicrobia bacterium LW23]